MLSLEAMGLSAPEVHSTVVPPMLGLDLLGLSVPSGPMSGSETSAGVPITTEKEEMEEE